MLRIVLLEAQLILGNRKPGPMKDGGATRKLDLPTFGHVQINLASLCSANKALGHFCGGGLPPV